MKKLNIFIVIWIIIGVLLVLISMHYRKQSDAIVAQVEPSKTAISFQKPVKIRNIHVIPGQDVNKGQLLIEVERPDLLYDIDKVNNELLEVKHERKKFISQINSQIQLNQLEKQNKINAIEEKVRELQTRSNLSNELKRTLSMDLEKERKGDQDLESVIQIQLEALKEEKRQVAALYSEQIQQLREKKENENQIYDIRIERLENELTLLEQEKNYLQTYSPIHGTIGDVQVQVGELIPPYETVLSIYEKYPRIIKAYMNEQNRYNVKIGDKVLVESSNRPYRIDGNVTEIGSRIISYPNRLLLDQNNKIWGQEIFIEIPDENEFLNGEKVYVNLK